MKTLVIIILVFAGIVWGINSGMLSGVINTAEMSSAIQTVIDDASISFGIGVVTVDPSAEIMGDEYLVNTINQCVFHSDDTIDGSALHNESIDEGICLVCQFKDGGGNVVAKALKDLPYGYTASDTLTLQIPEPDDPSILDVGNIETVNVLVQTVVLDFEGLPAGTVLDDEYSVFGISITGEKFGGGQLFPMVFDTNDNNTPDNDLEVDIGNISIIPHDDVAPFGGVNSETPANDSPNGGKQIFKFNPQRYVNSLVFVDADRKSPQGPYEVRLYGNIDCKSDLKATIPIDNTAGDGSLQVLVPIQKQQISCMVVEYNDSGGLASINLGCPLPDDNLDNLGVP